MHRLFFSPRCTSPSPSSLLLRCKLSSSSLAPPDLSSPSSDVVERIYRTLRSNSSSPHRLSAALRSLSVPDLLDRHPQILDRVISRCGPSVSLALPFISFASSLPSFSPSPSFPSSLLSLLSRSRDFPSSWSLLLHLRSHHPHLLSPDLFLILIRRFAKSNLASRAIHVLEEMPLLGCPVDDRIFFSLLDALAKNGAVKDAAKLFEEMRMRFPPTLKHFTSLLYGWCRAGKMDEARFVLVQMKDAGLEPDVVVYNTLIAGLCSVGKIEDGHQLLGEMRRKGCEPNVITYTTLIQALCSRERVDEAMRVFVEMRRHDVKADAVTYCTLIGGFAKTGKIERAFEFLDGMVRDGGRPSPAAYFPIFLALEKAENLERCLELMKQMSSKDRCFPDLGIYSTVIRLACKLGELGRAVELWNEMEASGLSPGLDSFVIVVHGFLGQGSLVEACNYFREMVNRGLLAVPQFGLMKDLLNSLLRAEKLDLAREIWGLIATRGGGKLNVYAWTIWIHALFARKHVKEACLYCIEMMEAGVMPQPDTFARLMKGLKKLYNRAIAAEMTEKVRAMAAERNVSFKSYKRRGVVDLEKKWERKKKMEEMKKKSRRPGGRGHSSRGRKNSFDLYREDP